MFTKIFDSLFFRKLADFLGNIVQQDWSFFSVQDRKIDFTKTSSHFENLTKICDLSNKNIKCPELIFNL